MFKKKTVIEVLERHNIHLSDEIFPTIYKKFHREKCQSRVKCINYQEICQLQRKNINSWLHIIQADVYHNSIDSCWQMNPLEDAVIIVTTNCCIFDIFYQKTRIFTYSPIMSSDIIFLPNIKALKPNFSLFNVYKYNDESGETSSLITRFEDLKNDDEIVCISKCLPSIIMKYQPYRRHKFSD